MISDTASKLRKLDISWNGLYGKQVEQLFDALSKNNSIEDLNLAMTAVQSNIKSRQSQEPDTLPTDTVKLRNFIKQNQNLLHIDLSGMFKTEE